MHAYYQTKMPAKFQNDWYKTLVGVVHKKGLLSVHFLVFELEKVTQFGIHE